MTKYELLLAKIQAEFPKFKIVPKDQSWLMKTANFFLLVITFGKQDRFMKSYTTTIGNTIYTASNWESKADANKIVIIRHERIHLRQFKKYTSILFSFLYLFVFFPTIFAYFRAKFEKEAYYESIKARLELYGERGISASFREHVIKQFIGAGYFFMWPFRKSTEKWFDNAVERARKEVNR
jgi:hypothetical protein